MKNLGALLRKHIAKCGYTIYKTAYLADVNRTTLQKVLSGDRTVSEDFLNKLLPVLKLSPREEQEIRELYEIGKTGERLLLQRKYICKMLETMSVSGSFITPPPRVCLPLHSQHQSLLLSPRHITN